MASKWIRDGWPSWDGLHALFGEFWDKGVDDLLTDAGDRGGGVGRAVDHDIDAFWLGTMGSGVSG